MRLHLITLDNPDPNPYSLCSAPHCGQHNGHCGQAGLRLIDDLTLLRSWNTEEFVMVVLNRVVSGLLCLWSFQCQTLPEQSDNVLGSIKSHLNCMLSRTWEDDFQLQIGNICVPVKCHNFHVSSSGGIKNKSLKAKQKKSDLCRKIWHTPLSCRSQSWFEIFDCFAKQCMPLMK